jgi:hypothetical protein
LKINKTVLLIHLEVHIGPMMSIACIGIPCASNEEMGEPWSFRTIEQLEGGSLRTGTKSGGGKFSINFHQF